MPFNHDRWLSSTNARKNIYKAFSNLFTRAATLHHNSALLINSNSVWCLLQKGLVPYNYLEPTLDISLGSKKIKVFFFFLDTFQLTSSNVICPNVHFCAYPSLAVIFIFLYLRWKSTGRGQTSQSRPSENTGEDSRYGIFDQANRV